MVENKVWFKVVATYAESGCTVEWKSRKESAALKTLAQAQAANAKSKAETGRDYYSSIELVRPAGLPDLSQGGWLNA